MTKTIQKHASLIGGLFFLAQSTMVPTVSAAGLLADNSALYWQAATSADPIIFDNQNFADSGIKVVENAEDAVSVGKVIDNPEPTIQEIKDYVLNEIKKAGLNASQAAALINCESRWDYQAVNDKNRNGTTDLGLWQINSIHKDISDADKLDYKASTEWAIAKRLNDGNWRAWSCSRKIARY